MANPAKHSVRKWRVPFIDKGVRRRQVPWPQNLPRLRRYDLPSCVGAFAKPDQRCIAHRDRKSQLVPGHRLIEKDLCEQLAVSRTSLRGALRALQAEGIGPFY